MLIYFLMQGKHLINLKGIGCKFCSPRNKNVPALALHAVRPVQLLLRSVAAVGAGLFLFKTLTD